MAARSRLLTSWMGWLAANRLHAFVLQRKHQVMERLVSFSFTTICTGNSISSNACSDISNVDTAVYKHKIKFRRPPEIICAGCLFNSVSLIGTVLHPLKRCATSDDKNFGVYTVLGVGDPNDSRQNFRILLKMWDEIANMSMENIEVGEFIHVKGRLNLYEKADTYGKLKTHYEIAVNDLNYVKPIGEGLVPRSSNWSQEGISGSEEKEDRLHLWQIFFACPEEWWDNRKKKPNPSFPDFKHKDTEESLWLSPSDPPWIKKQLSLLDLRMQAANEKGVDSSFSISKWVHDV